MTHFLSMRAPSFFRAIGRPPNLCGLGKSYARLLGPLGRGIWWERWDQLEGHLTCECGGAVSGKGGRDKLGEGNSRSISLSISDKPKPRSCIHP